MNTVSLVLIFLPYNSSNGETPVIACGVERYVCKKSKTACFHGFFCKMAICTQSLRTLLNLSTAPLAAGWYTDVLVCAMFRSSKKAIKPEEISCGPLSVTRHSEFQCLLKTEFRNPMTTGVVMEGVNATSGHFE